MTLTSTERQKRKLTRERVARGVKVLDAVMPTWFKKINLDTLELASCEACVCGQLAFKSRSKLVQNHLNHYDGDHLNHYDGEHLDRYDGGYLTPYSIFRDYLYGRTRRKNQRPYGTWSFRHGFTYEGASFDDLNREWRRVIRRKLREAAS